MKFMIRKTPDSFLESVNNEISSILSRNLDGRFFDSSFYEENKLAIPVELTEKENEYFIKAELPGVKKEDIDIDIEKNCITINAKKEEEKEENNKLYQKSEFSYGEFSRTVYLPQEIDTENTTAKLDFGILKIKAHKKGLEKEKTRKITVQ